MEIILLKYQIPLQYSSWSNIVQKNYKPIKVDLIVTTSRHMEMVQVHEEFMPHPPEVKYVQYFYYVYWKFF